MEVNTIGFKSSCCTSLNQTLLGIEAGRSLRIGDATSLVRLSYLWFSSDRVSISGSSSLYVSNLEASFSTSCLCPLRRLSAAVYGDHTAFSCRFRRLRALVYSVLVISSCFLWPLDCAVPSNCPEIFSIVLRMSCSSLCFLASFVPNVNVIPGISPSVPVG